MQAPDRPRRAFSVFVITKAAAAGESSECQNGGYLVPRGLGSPAVVESAGSCRLIPVFGLHRGKIARIGPAALIANDCWRGTKRMVRSGHGYQGDQRKAA